MARFKGSVQGSRGEASRLGGTESGLRVYANGWRSGVMVRGEVNEDGEDVFYVYATGGSGPGYARMLGRLKGREWQSNEPEGE